MDILIAERLHCSVQDLDETDALLVNRVRVKIIAESNAKAHKRDSIVNNDTIH